MSKQKVHVSFLPLSFLLGILVLVLVGLIFQNACRLRIQSQKVTEMPRSNQPISQSDATYSIQKKQISNKSDSYNYSLISNNGDIIYSVTNYYGFNFQTSKDNKYIAIINYSSSVGDETLTLIDNQGKVLKNFGHLNSPQGIVPLTWSDHYFWIVMGPPMGEPYGVVRINAENLELNTYISN